MKEVRKLFILDSEAVQHQYVEVHMHLSRLIGLIDCDRSHIIRELLVIVLTHVNDQKFSLNTGYQSWSSY